MSNLLSSIQSPEDLKQLPSEKLEQLCAEIRQQIIQTVSTNGGHLASNLGVVELTVALHRVFQSPEDAIIWDVGHQAYTHKMLTGRLDRIDSIRTRGGLSGFPNRKESPHDPLTSGHSSTSISAALGIFKAKELKGEPGHVVAVIGDGALTGGLAYEGMNNAGRLHKNFIVVLNDNKMSISRNVGSMARYLARIRTKPSYFRFKGNIETILDHIPGVGKPFRHALTKSKAVLKQLLYNSTIFEDMGFYYYGPFDGHDTEKLIEVFNNVKTIEHPVLIHVMTQKGRGYSFAEKNPKAFHGISRFNVETGEPVQSSSGGSFSSVFGNKICSLAAADERICVITAAMQEGTGLTAFAKKFPERFFDTGIAEEHAITFAGGLACQGMLPVFAVYSSFLQRGYDQIIHDVALQRTKVVLAVDRAGIVGEDGETHHGIFDPAFLRTIPGITIYSPSYYDELKICLHQALYYCEGLAAVRYPRGGQLYCPYDFHGTRKAYDIYGNESANIVIVTYGRLFSNACQALITIQSKGLNARIIKLNRIFPIDQEAIQIALKADVVFFFEEGIEQGGIGEHFAYLLNQAAYKGKFYLRAIHDFVPHESMQEALEQLGLSAEGMANLIISECSH
ncbi:MAG: 1-deoxy-D-xylulose-5-phosphate synthase [Oscillospiraceae bacterium]|jgi:1-deoxy-D-xylulose-5-phosphate synthase